MKSQCDDVSSPYLNIDVTHAQIHSQETQFMEMCLISMKSSAHIQK